MERARAPETLLEVNSLGLVRGGRELFTDLSFEVHGGQMWQVEGSNGAGKTSLLRILCGLSRFGYEGSVTRHTAPLYLGHRPAVKGLLSPRENLAWHAGGDGQYADSDIDAALSRVGLYGYEDVPSYTLSAGQHRRVSLARLYLADSRLWILDEPFTAIDRSGVEDLEALMSTHVEKGGALMITSHQALRAKSDIHSLQLGGNPAR